MKKLILIFSVLFFACTEEITPLPAGSSNVLTIQSNQYTEVKIQGFGSVWVDGSFKIVVPKGILKYESCGKVGEFTHDGKTNLIIECQ